MAPAPRKTGRGVAKGGGQRAGDHDAARVDGEEQQPHGACDPAEQRARDDLLPLGAVTRLATVSALSRQREHPFP